VQAQVVRCRPGVNQSWLRVHEVVPLGKWTWALLEGRERPRAQAAVPANLVLVLMAFYDPKMQHECLKNEKNSHQVSLVLMLASFLSAICSHCPALVMLQTISLSDIHYHVFVFFLGEPPLLEHVPITPASVSKRQHSLS
jgi:hypothetical protein